MIVSVTRCWNKSSPKYTNCCPKINHRWFYLKSDTFRKSPKSHRTLGLLLEKKSVAKNFQKSPNLVTLMIVKSSVLFCSRQGKVECNDEGREKRVDRKRQISNGKPLVGQQFGIDDHGRKAFEEQLGVVRCDGDDVTERQIKVCLYWRFGCN